MGTTKRRCILTFCDGSEADPGGRYVNVTAITPHSAGRGQDHHHNRTHPGAGRKGPKRDGLYPPAQHGPHFRDQGRRGGGRVQPGDSHGGVQPPPHRRSSRHRSGPQPGSGRHRRPMVFRGETRRPANGGAGVETVADRSARGFVGDGWWMSTTALCATSCWGWAAG